jgi:hypothetical protein
MQPMLTLFLQSSIFVAGAIIGYAVCLWRSHRRRAQFISVTPRISMFGHPRRAF